ncbi:type-F conjugative transfer system pilin assembly protein TrbC [Enterovibrio norvegicus]|uniref:Type-F conjugative transfer system pilin assembly protein TrbC n=1 Tax=Enterovibrio norvegicus TaxID=188144 RepID=A0ABV4L556_9GAMM
MPLILTTLFLVPCLFFSTLAIANVGYTTDELKALAKREQAITEPAHTYDIDALIKRSHQYRADALSMNAHLDDALAQSPIASALETPNPNKDAKGVMVFVSLSMPDAALRQLLKQSKQYQIPLVIRGVLPEGFTATAARIQSLLDSDDMKIESGFAINPSWFRQFDIRHVPAFVSIGDSCLPESCDVKEYDIVHGNISLPHALDVLSQGDVGHVARRFLEK